MTLIVWDRLIKGPRVCFYHRGFPRTRTTWTNLGDDLVFRLRWTHCVPGSVHRWSPAGSVLSFVQHTDLSVLQMWTLGLLGVLSLPAEVCFQDLGCFQDLPPWGGTDQRPASKNKYYQEIKADTSMHVSNYSGRRKTRFIIPGYLDKGDEDWTQELCRSMLKWENINCIAVDWNKGVRTTYASGANNVRVLGAQVASMVAYVMSYYKQKADAFHLIGHSLGAHAAGDAGSRISGLGRITGLDPTEPYFEGCNASVRLDSSDVLTGPAVVLLWFSSGLGMTQPVGHVDFYPNGGELMPGCKSNKGKPTELDAIWEGTANFDACNHVRAYQYYSESVVKAQGFMGYPCPDKDSFASEKCFPCADKTCPLMGHRVDRSPVTPGQYFLHTGDSTPFGRTLTLDGPSWPNPAFMYVALNGDNDSTDEYQLHVGSMIPGKTYELLLNAIDVGEVMEVKFRWNNHIPNIMKPQVWSVQGGAAEREGRQDVRL
uniref:Lipase domain-containing protein n=1 Tax=Sphaeramia orbicularis TaxID=375764 RepID=A0A673BFK1_9TELE